MPRMKRPDTKTLGAAAQVDVEKAELPQARSQWNEDLKKALERIGDTEDPELCIAGFLMTPDSEPAPFFVVPARLKLAPPGPELARKSSKNGLSRLFNRSNYSRFRQSFWWWDRQHPSLWNHIPLNLVKPFRTLNTCSCWLWSKERELGLEEGRRIYFSLGVRYPKSEVAVEWSTALLSHSLPWACRAQAIAGLRARERLSEEPLLEKALETHLNCIEFEQLPHEDGYVGYGELFHGRRPTLYSTVEALADATYESQANSGVLALASPSDVVEPIALTSPESIANTKLLRKLLECRLGARAVCVGPGLGGILKAYAFAEIKPASNAITFLFQGGGWEMKRAGQVVIQRRDGRLTLGGDEHLNQLQSEYQKLFRRKMPPLLANYHRWISQEKRGAVLIIHGEAAASSRGPLGPQLSHHRT